MSEPLTKDKDYSTWLKELKNKVRLVQIKAAVKVNSKMLRFYWELGHDIVDKQKKAKWGDGFLKQLSIDLSSEFPNMKGFSKRNLENIRKWYHCWSKNSSIAKQLATQTDSTRKGLNDIIPIFQIPWWQSIN